MVLSDYRRKIWHYQCCRKQGTNDGMTFHAQQQLMSSQLDRPNLNPRANFHKDLKHFLQQQVGTPDTTRLHIILCDWNEECSGTSTSQKLCDLLGLVDLWKYCNPKHSHFKTYHRGNRRIEFALTTPHLASLAVNMVYGPFFYRALGDHQGFYINFDTSSLFTATIPTFGFSPRGFTSKDQKAVTTSFYLNSRIIWMPIMCSNNLAVLSRQECPITTSSKPSTVKLLEPASM